MTDRAHELAELARLHYPGVWRFLRRLGFEPHVIDDATQDLFLVAHRRFDDMKPGSERAFLFGAALRIASNLKKKSAREVPTDVVVDEEEIDEGADALDERVDGARARARLYRLLSELDESLRVVFVMFELEEMATQEIADVLGLPVGTVASRLRRAREDFHARFARYRKSNGGGQNP